MSRTLDKKRGSKTKITDSPPPSTNSSTPRIVFEKADSSPKLSLAGLASISASTTETGMLTPNSQANDEPSSPLALPRRLASVTISGTNSGVLNFNPQELDPALTGIAKTLAMRSRLCTEVKDTEYSYLTSLRTAIQSFLSPIKEKVGKADEILTSDEINVIFNNVTEIEEHSASFWRELAARCKTLTDETCFGDVFLKYLNNKSFTNAYVNYINGYDLAIAAIGEKFKTKKDKFAQFIKAVEEKEKDQSYFKNLSFTSFLITPVQRIPRYVLLLKDLLKNTPEDHADYENVKIALEKISKIATLINERKREDEQLRKMQELVEHFENKEEIASLQLVTPGIGRYYIAEGPINEVQSNGNTENRTLIVLSDMLIATNKKGKDRYVYKWRINLLNCKIDDKEVEGGFKVYELRKIPDHPYIVEESVVLTPTKEPQFNAEFWLKTFNTASSVFWSDQKARIIQNSQEMKKHMIEHLLTEKDWRLLNSSMTTLTLQRDDVVLKEGEVFKYLYWITKGTVRVQKVLGAETVVFAKIGKEEFFGEMSYLKKKEQKIGASVVADVDDTVIQYIPEDKLDTLLLANLALAERFFKLLCYILASRFVERPLEKALQKKNDDDEEEADKETDKDKEASKEQSGSKIENKPASTLKASSGSKTDASKKEEKKKLASEEKKLKSVLSSLKLPSTEVLLEEFSVVLKDKKQHGQMYVFQKNVGFYSKIFGRKTTLVLQMNLITDLVKEGTNILSITASKKLYSFTFETTDSRDQAEAIIKNQRGGSALQRTASVLLDSSKAQAAMRNDALKLQPKDWEEILYGCATTVSCPENEPILRQGDIQQRLYQVVDGVCRVELSRRDMPDEKIIVGSIKKGEVFGELSFVLGGIASASVVADKGAVKVVFFERAKLDALFQQKPKLGAGFYFYLARQIRNRLIENQKKAASEKKN